MAYLVLARKWRPGSFEAIIGQEHVTRALRNAIRLDRVAHAFLFTGARGVGKTTAARVMAKALQCAKGPTEEPCGECPACTEIATSTNIDVFEIDGASNRGINEIRELRDGVAYAPQRDRFKIYIIDEVHMLTQEAFNALLKTLEEPPRHVKFIFATTEPQKIPVTILSRCQRYDFKRVPLSLVKRHLDDLLTREGVKIAEEGVRMVARESEGSMRDALSLLDRVISYAGTEATGDDVATCLGIADRQWVFELMKALVGGNASGALAVVANVNEYGLDLRAFAEEALETLRDLVVVKIAGADARATDLSDAEARALAALGANHHLIALQRIFQILLKAVDEMAESRHPKLVLEMALVRATAALDFAPLADMVARLESLESRLGSEALANASRQVAPSRPAAPQVAPLRAPQSSTAPAPAASPTPSMAPNRAAAARPGPQGPASAGAAGADALTPERWPAFVGEVKQRDPLLATMLEASRILSAAPGALKLGVGNAFYAKQLASGPSHERLLAALRGRFGELRLEVEQAGAEGTIAAARKERAEAFTADRRASIEQHPVTRAAVEASQGRIVDVRVEDDDSGDD